MSEAFDPLARNVLVPVTRYGPRDNYTFKCAVDTGCSYSVLPVGYLRLVGYDLTRPVGRTNLRTASSVVPAPLFRITALAALGKVSTNIIVAAHDLPSAKEHHGLLGLDFFRGQVLTLDFNRGWVSLSAPKRWWQFWW